MTNKKKLDWERDAKLKTPTKLDKKTKKQLKMLKNYEPPTSESIAWKRYTSKFRYDMTKE